MYALAGLLHVMALLALLGWWSSRSRRAWLAYVLASAAGLYTVYLSAVMLLIHNLWVAGRLVGRGRGEVDSEPQTIDHRPRTIDDGPQTTDHRPRTIDHSNSQPSVKNLPVCIGCDLIELRRINLEALRQHPGDNVTQGVSREPGLLLRFPEAHADACPCIAVHPVW